MQLRRGFSNILLGSVLGLASAFCLSPARADQSADALLGNAFAEIENNRLDLALDHIEALLRAKPNFRLAYLIKGDLLLARGRAL
jgi:predicted Zn-dependent protease